MSSTMEFAGTAKDAKHPNEWWVGFVCGMATFVDNAATTGVATAFVLYQSGGKLSGGQIGMLTAALTVGVTAGSFLGGRLGDRFGRRHVFIATMAVIILGAFIPFV